MKSNVENQKKALQNVACGHVDDAVTPDDFENIIHPPLELKSLHYEEADMTKKTSNKTDSSKQTTPEKSIVTTKPTPNQSRDFEDDFHDPYWN